MRKLAAAIVALAALGAADMLASDGELGLISDDGTSRTSLGVRVSDPSWAPDAELVVGRVGSTELAAIPGGEALYQPAWSPDGAEIATSRSTIDFDSGEVDTRRVLARPDSPPLKGSDPYFGCGNCVRRKRSQTRSGMSRFWLISKCALGVTR